MPGIASVDALLEWWLTDVRHQFGDDWSDPAAPLLPSERRDRLSGRCTRSAPRRCGPGWLGVSPAGCRRSKLLGAEVEADPGQHWRHRLDGAPTAGEERKAVAVVQAQIQVHGVTVRDRVHHVPGADRRALEPAHLIGAAASRYHGIEALLLRMPLVVGPAGLHDLQVRDQREERDDDMESVTAKSWTMPG